MEWLNLHSSVLDSPEFVGEEPVNQATWLKLQRFCIGQENGGSISDCREWKDRKWQQLVRVTKREVESESELWAWDGDSLIVAFYPKEKQAEVQHLRTIGKLTTPAKQAAAKANGQLGGRPSKNQSSNPTETQHETHEKPIEGKGREGNGMEKRESAPPKLLSGDPKSICDAYPRREKTAEALAIVAKSLADGEDFAVMLAGTRACAAVIRTLPSGHLNRYVPSAESFFLHKRWKDDPETLRRQGSQSTGQGHVSLEDAAKSLGRRAFETND